jgi:hypothetical protein
MRWFRLLPLLLALSFDFVTLDTPLFQPGPRAVQVDDEEESTPRRPVRLRPPPSSVTAVLPAHRYVVAPRVRPPEHVSRTIRWSDPPPWVGPIVQARSAPGGSLAAPEAH